MRWDKIFPISFIVATCAYGWLTIPAMYQPVWPFNIAIFSYRTAALALVMAVGAMLYVRYVAAWQERLEEIPGSRYFQMGVSVLLLSVIGSLSMEFFLSMRLAPWLLSRPDGLFFYLLAMSGIWVLGFTLWNWALKSLLYLQASHAKEGKIRRLRGF